MDTPTVREKLTARIEELDDEQIARVLRYVETMQSMTLPDDYDEENDPSIGFISGPTDLASRTREILQDLNRFR